MVEVLRLELMTATTTRSAIVAHLADLPVDTLRMVRVGQHRVCLVHSASGVHAIDNACPHEGYGLTQGGLAGDVLTCEWHNWKFQVSTGRCLVGEEDVVSHRVDIAEDGAITVTLADHDPHETTPTLLVSLRRGIAHDYVGQMSRDVIRLLKNDVNPGELVWEAVAFGAPRGEFGWGHSIASAADCLAMVDNYQHDARALPIVQAIAGIAEVERDRPINPLPVPVASMPRQPLAEFCNAVESEDLTQAQALVRGAIANGMTANELRPWFTSVVSAHHLSYGHGAIYAHKAFQLLDRIGWERADTVLPHLVPTLVYGTREDKLPYMRPFMRALGGADLFQLADVAPVSEWDDDGCLVRAMLDTSDRVAACNAAIAALHAGAGVDRVLDAVVTAVSERLLRYDVTGEFDFRDDFGWLDITHGLTYANAARWHHQHAPGPETARLALFTVFQALWTGRHEWHSQVGPRHHVDVGSTDPRTAGLALQDEALSDRTSQFIVFAHAVKMSVAATEEATRSNSLLPLQAAARFMREPRLERFVAATVARSVDFLNGRVVRGD